MIVNDIVYGEHTIHNPKVVTELLRDASMQRLKGVNPAGYFTPFYSGAVDTRWDHSVGVYLLLEQFKAPIKERIAGLIHDVSHSAFSHCIDYVFDEGSGKEHNYQDDIFEEYVNTTNIPAILKKHLLDPNEIMDESNFPMLETKLPSLCADRIDYSLRGGIIYGEINKEKAKKFLDALEIVDSKWVFKDYSSALEYAKFFKMMNDKWWSGIQAATMFNATGEALKYALSAGYISRGDLYTVDDIVLSKIRDKEFDPQMGKLFKRMNNQTRVIDDPDDHQYVVYCKSRVVDPLFMESGRTSKLSDADAGWKETVEKGLKPKEYFLRYED